jgi:hypothetical protein
VGSLSNFDAIGRVGVFERDLENLSRKEATPSQIGSVPDHDHVSHCFIETLAERAGARCAEAGALLVGAVDETGP